MFDELKFKIQKGDALIRVIIINFLIFIPLLILHVISELTKTPEFFETIFSFTSFSSLLHKAVFKPWTILSYGFAHYEPMHFIFNMLGLYWFGGIVQEYLGEKRFVNIYILGVIMGALFFFAGMNAFPIFEGYSPNLVGASASVYALAFATITLLPTYTIYFPIFGEVRLYILVLIYITISIAGTIGPNAGGNFSHIGGAFLGFLYIKLLNKGNDIGSPIQALGRLISNQFKPKPKLKVTYRNPSKTQNEVPDQEEIDRILDKINQMGGYNALSTEEKEKLFKYSQNEKL